MTFVPRFAGAQTNKKVITGSVFSAEDGRPLNGATVTVKGTQSVTATDSSGRFTIQAAQNDVLLTSFVGFTPFETTVGTGSEVNSTTKSKRTIGRRSGSDRLRFTKKITPYGCDFPGGRKGYCGNSG